MENDFNDRLVLAQHERRVYQPYDDYFLLQPGQLIHGVCDFTSDKPVRVFLMMYPANADPFNYAEILPKDKQRLRGTFKNMNRTLTLKRPYDWQKDGLGYILIGDNVNDLFKRGVDATDGSEVINYGNSGMIQTPDTRLYFDYRTPPEPPSVAQARVEGISIMTETTELSELGSYRGQVSFEYSPPGASNLPVNIVLMPDNQ